jgi:hypothetical protein
MQLGRFKQIGFIWVLSFVAFNFSLSFAHANWQSDLEKYFDIVETFDDIQNWRGTGFGDIYNQADMPIQSDGSASRWQYYSYWVSYPSIQDWIANFGSTNTWRQKGKSLCIDISGNGSDQGGPSRLGIYFGDGEASSGYSDLYLFHMVKISSNQWPTTINGDVGEYASVTDKYAYFESWKFGTFNMGCKSCSCAKTGGNYSPYHVIPHIKTSTSVNYTPSIRLEPNDDGNRQGIWTNAPFIRDEWTGVEFHLRNVNEDGTQYTYMDVWIYDKDGVATQVISNYKYAYSSQPTTDKWNHFFFGGNNSSSYNWGDSMQGPYYVDDFIIHSSRIGPSYFALLSGQETPIDIQPKNPKATVGSN